MEGNAALRLLIGLGAATQTVDSYMKEGAKKTAEASAKLLK